MSKLTPPFRLSDEHALKYAKNEFENIAKRLGKFIAKIDYCPETKVVNGTVPPLSDYFESKDMDGILNNIKQAKPENDYSKALLLKLAADMKGFAIQLEGIADKIDGTANSIEQKLIELSSNFENIHRDIICLDSANERDGYATFTGKRRFLLEHFEDNRYEVIDPEGSVISTGNNLNKSRSTAKKMNKEHKIVNDDVVLSRSNIRNYLTQYVTSKFNCARITNNDIKLLSDKIDPEKITKIDWAGKRREKLDGYMDNIIDSLNFEPEQARLNADSRKSASLIMLLESYALDMAKFAKTISEQDSVIDKEKLLFKAKEALFQDPRMTKIYALSRNLNAETERHDETFFWIYVKASEANDFLKGLSDSSHSKLELEEEFKNFMFDTSFSVFCSHANGLYRHAHILKETLGNDGVTPFTAYYSPVGGFTNKDYHKEFAVINPNGVEIKQDSIEQALKTAEKLNEENGIEVQKSPEQSFGLY